MYIRGALINHSLEFWFWWTNLLSRGQACCPLIVILRFINKISLVPSKFSKKIIIRGALTNHSLEFWFWWANLHMNYQNNNFYGIISMHWDNNWSFQKWTHMINRIWFINYSQAYSTKPNYWEGKGYAKR